MDNDKIGTSVGCSETPEPIDIKFCRNDFVGDPRMPKLKAVVLVVPSRQIGEILITLAWRGLLFLFFFLTPVVAHTQRPNRRTKFLHV